MESSKQQSVKIELLSSAYAFTSAGVAVSTLTAHAPQSDFPKPGDIKKGFTVKFSVDLKAFSKEETILEIPQILNVRLRKHDATNRDRQNYPAFGMSDGSVPVLEASVKLKLYPDSDEMRDMIVGIPLAMLDTPFGKHEVILNFSGVCWNMYVDGKLLDNEFALGYPVWEGKNVWKINSDYIQKAEIYCPVLREERLTAEKPETVSEIQFWTPTGHNAWVGDVATIYHQGRYHVFYLYDRRHHASKFGRGGHYFEHLSTADFKTWTEHEAATPIEEQWETFGTGTPFVTDGKLCISYGYHTTRIYPREKTTLPLQWEFLKKNGYTGSFPCDMLQGFPAGASYSVSADGISNFKKSGIVFHTCENPSVFTDPEGKLKMFANYQSKGTWASDSIKGGWHCINPEFPLGGDCTFYFRWGKFDYAVGGFVNLWSKSINAADSAYTDLAGRGIDFYDGTNVPAVSEISGGRFVMAGWMPIHGWGGPLIIHELIQFPDGRLGSKWMDEIIPETETFRRLADKVTEPTHFSTDNQSFILTFRVSPKTANGKLGIVFSNGNGEENVCELQIGLDEKRAQFGKGTFNNFAEKEKSLREGGSPHEGRNYAVENLQGIDKPFVVRILVKFSDKLGGSMIDAEIAGQRTMVSYRPELFVKKLLFRPENVELSNVKIGKCF